MSNATANTTTFEMPSVGQTIHGFLVKQITPVPDYSGTAYVMEHQVSGTQLVFLANQDTEKGCTISFRTPAFDNTGVFHILEHSVLQGSRKFPVRNVFDHLRKTSACTFLNAMTGSCSTQFMFTTVPHKDFANVLDVYMDAVLHPLVMEDERIFRQEGWRNEIVDGKLAYNGVVLNEMQGYETPMSVFSREYNKALFPDNHEGFVSGGIPAEIPDLSYEQLKTTYYKHYRLDNCQIVLFGDMDMDATLTFLDREYLTPVAQERASMSANSVTGPIAIPTQSPVKIGNLTVEVAETEEKNSCSFQSVLPGKPDAKERTAAMVLMNVLFNNNEAPFKKAFDAADFCLNGSGFADFSGNQLSATITASKTNPGSRELFLKTLMDTARKTVEQGISRELLRARIANLDFFLKARENHPCDALVFMGDVLSIWNNDNRYPLGFTLYSENIAFMYQMLETDYFERLLAKFTFEAEHYICTECICTGTSDAPSALEVRTKADAALLSNENIAAIQATNADFQRWQESDDSPEALATLPVLSKADLLDVAKLPECEERTLDGLHYLRHSVPTSGIAYIRALYDISFLPQSDLPYAHLLSSLLTSNAFGTSSHSAEEIALEKSLKLGAFMPFIQSCKNPKDSHIQADVLVMFSSTEANVASAAKLTKEILSTCDFSNLKKLLQLMGQCKVGMQSAKNQATWLARPQLASCLDASKRIAYNNSLEIIEFNIALAEKVQANEKALEELAQKLTSLSHEIFGREPRLTSFAGSEEAFEAFHDVERMQQMSGDSSIFSDSEEATLASLQPLPAIDTAVITDSNVAVNVQGTKTAPLSPQEFALAKIVSKTLSDFYLWNMIRVQGGAYGTYLDIDKQGMIFAMSHNDPHTNESFSAFSSAFTFLKEHPLPQEMLDATILSLAMKNLKPLRPSMIQNKQLAYFLEGVGADCDEQIRAAMLEATSEAVSEFADKMEEVFTSSIHSTWANRSMIEECSLDFEVCNPFKL